MEDDEDIDGIVKTEEDDSDVTVTQMLSVVNAGGNLIRTNHTTLQSLLSTPISGSQVFAQSDGIQVITLPTTSSELMGLGADATNRLIQMLPASDLSGLGTKYIGLIAISNPSALSQGKGDLPGLPRLEMAQTSEESELNSSTTDDMATLLMPPPSTPTNLQSNCPPWAMRLKKCEKIGDSYRGYVENEIDLDLILTLHKQHTNSFWGTRQSPSPAKTSTRLMWKSQYVPFDGIPFVNAGSRAVVMECQFGPRRKGTLGKRGTASNTSNEFKQTCPARIYIKKVRKFPSFAVNLNMEKKSVRYAMDKAFHELRELCLDSWGEERYYVQLPTEKAHDYHEDNYNARVEAVVKEESSNGQQSFDMSGDARIHPAVLDKIRQLVASGETKLYTIRRQLRRFVVRDMFQGSGLVPERHDLTMFPTVNDLKNHIHQAFKDIESGVLPYTPQLQVNLEVIQGGSDGSSSEEKESGRDEKADLSSMWSGSSILSGGAIPETVTVTLTQSPGEDGHHIISRIETHLSDGTTQVSTTLTPETAQLLSQLHPGLFPTGSILQLEDTRAQSPSSKSFSNDMDGMEITQDASSIENPVSGLDTSISGLDTSMEEAVNVIEEDIDTSHPMAEINSTAMLVSPDPNLLNSDDSSLAGIVASERSHHMTGLIIPDANISVLAAVDSPALTDIVSVANQNPVTLVSGDSVHAIDLVSGDSVTTSLSLEGDDACEQIIHKPEGLEDERHEKLNLDDKLALHITSDQKIGMTRLENKVSDL